MQVALRETLEVDDKHQIHIDIPLEMGDQVEIIVFSSQKVDMAKVMDISGFAQDVLASPEEDCWNDL